MTTITHSSAALSPLTSSDEFPLDPRKSLPDYRREIYDLLQYLDEEQDKIEKELARFSISQRKQSARRQTNDEDESEEDDDFVVVEDVNAASRKKQLLNQLQQLWRTRDALRKRAEQLNIRIDSLLHGKGSGLMPTEDLVLSGISVHGQDNGDEF